MKPRFDGPDHGSIQSACACSHLIKNYIIWSSKSCGKEFKLAKLPDTCNIDFPDSFKTCSWKYTLQALVNDEWITEFTAKMELNHWQ